MDGIRPRDSQWQGEMWQPRAVSVVVVNKRYGNSAHVRGKQASCCAVYHSLVAIVRAIRELHHTAVPVMFTLQATLSELYSF